MGHGTPHARQGARACVAILLTSFNQAATQERRVIQGDKSSLPMRGNLQDASENERLLCSFLIKVSCYLLFLPMTYFTNLDIRSSSVTPTRKSRIMSVRGIRSVRKGRARAGNVACNPTLSGSLYFSLSFQRRCLILSLLFVVSEGTNSKGGREGMVERAE